MSKETLVHEILQHNQSAEPAILMSFDEKVLSSYLHRLTQVLGHRGPNSVWVRDGSTSAIVTRTHAPTGPLAAA